jgi:hypothetical protein
MPRGLPRGLFTFSNENQAQRIVGLKFRVYELGRLTF